MGHVTVPFTMAVEFVGKTKLPIAPHIHEKGYGAVVYKSVQQEAVKFKKTINSNKTFMGELHFLCIAMPKAIIHTKGDSDILW